jgi:xanthine dehydrogenase accessory factor
MLLSDYPADEVDEIPAGAYVLVLTHSHALDLEIVTHLLRRDDLAYTGVIGSATKASLFRRRLAERGVDAGGMVCPIGVAVPGARNRQADKHPGAIALSVATDLLARRHSHSHAGVTT